MNIALNRNQPEDGGEGAQGHLERGQGDRHVVGGGRPLEIPDGQGRRERAPECPQDRHHLDVGALWMGGRPVAGRTGLDRVEAERHQLRVDRDEHDGADGDQDEEGRRAEQDVAEASQLRVLEVQPLVAVPHQASDPGPPNRGWVLSQLLDGELSGIVPVQ